MKQDIINYCSTLLDTDDTEMLGVLYEIVCNEFMDYCNRNDVPTNAISVIANMVCVQFNRRGNQGLSSQGYSGVSEAYIDGYPDNVLKQLNRYRRISII